MKLAWDDKIPSKYLSLWHQWLVDLPKLSKFTIARCIKPPDFTVKSTQLHHFSDASEKGYGSVSYLRLLSHDDTVHCMFLMGKSRLTPLKPMTIPRLELSAATVSVRVDMMLERELDISAADTTFWTDSTSVVRYVENEDKRFHVFVANKIAVIRERSVPTQRRHVNGKLNPADYASRGLSINAFLKTCQWINGPEFLWNSNAEWPQRPPALGEIPVDDPEVRRETAVCTTDVHNRQVRDNYLYSIVDRFSSWYRAKKVVAWILRNRTKLLQANSKRKEGKIIEFPKSPSTKSLLLRVDEVEATGKDILRCVQHCSFSDVIKALQTNSTTVEECNKTKKYSRVKKSSPLSKLDPVWQNGLLLVGGRLQAASIPDNAKHQVILPKNNHVADIIIRHYHHISGHLGREYVLALIRRKFWIIQANSAVRKFLSKCVECRKRKAEVLNQKMADLPEDRLISDQPPFTYVGIDYFGPFHVRRGRSLVKRYGAIFTCLTIRAVHIEISHSLDTDSFLLALRRFLARRGQVKEIRSDNGTNFTSGEKELREAVGTWNQAKIHDHLSQRNIKWLFNPPYGSHHGGIWERCIRTARNILRA